MRFGRASDNGEGRELQGTVKILSSAENPNPRGWICSADATHFRLNGSKS
jgi:hypothetical protein